MNQQRQSVLCRFDDKIIFHQNTAFLKSLINLFKPFVYSKMSKEDILINYLNKINFGNSARGIQRGAQYYFGKNQLQRSILKLVL